VREQPVETHRAVDAQEPASSSSTFTRTSAPCWGLGPWGRSSWERRKEREELIGMGEKALSAGRRRHGEVNR
jgi:hypothetical protein